MLEFLILKEKYRGILSKPWPYFQTVVFIDCRFCVCAVGLSSVLVGKNTFVAVGEGSFFFF